MRNEKFYDKNGIGHGTEYDMETANKSYLKESREAINIQQRILDIEQLNAEISRRTSKELRQHNKYMSDITKKNFELEDAHRKYMKEIIFLENSSHSGRLEFLIKENIDEVIVYLSEKINHKMLSIDTNVIDQEYLKLHDFRSRNKLYCCKISCLTSELSNLKKINKEESHILNVILSIFSVIEKVKMLRENDSRIKKNEIELNDLVGARNKTDDCINSTIKTIDQYKVALINQSFDKIYHQIKLDSTIDAINNIAYEKIREIQNKYPEYVRTNERLSNDYLVKNFANEICEKLSFLIINKHTSQLDLCDYATLKEVT